MNTKRELEIIDLLKSINKNLNKINAKIDNIDYQLYKNNKADLFGEE